MGQLVYNTIIFHALKCILNKDIMFLKKVDSKNIYLSNVIYFLNFIIFLKYKWSSNKKKKIEIKTNK